MDAVCLNYVKLMARKETVEDENDRMIVFTRKIINRRSLPIRSTKGYKKKDRRGTFELHIARIVKYLLNDLHKI